MNLQSDNVGIKRPKLSLSPIIRNEIKQNEEDIISRLPDEILTHILSLLPDNDAYRCRILSNRWNHLCFFLPFLCFKMPSYKYPVEFINKFYDFVDKTFSIRNRDMPVIKRFFLSCTYHYDHNRVLDWLRIVFRSKHIQKLELRFPSKQDRFSLSLDLLMTFNNTLVDLTLKGVNMVGIDETQLLFPCLKRLKLKSIVYSGDESLQNLISTCPVLQELFLEEQWSYVQLPVYKISSVSLKRLRIRSCIFGARVVAIDTPKLEYFYINTRSYDRYSLTYLSCLVEAHIDRYAQSDVPLLPSVLSARILTLTSASLLVSREEGLNLPVFPNLVKIVVIFDDIPVWDWFFILLKSMPHLQHITIHIGYYHSPFEPRWNPPTPACLLFIVKEVVILIQKAKAVQVKEHVTLIRYLLKHSSVLEKLTLNANAIDLESREKILNIRCRSKSCLIEFV